MFAKLKTGHIRAMFICLGLFTVLSIYTFSEAFPDVLKLEQRLKDYFFVKYYNNVTCRLPSLDPFQGIHEQFLRSEPVTCDSANWIKVFSTDLNSNLVMLFDPKSIGWERCCYQSFGSGSQSSTAHHNPVVCVPILKPVTEIPRTVESILVFCAEGSEQRLVDMFLLFRAKGRRIESKQETKFNIILLGLDSVSRMNFMRMMPFAAEYLRNDLAAIEMEGYIDLASWTLPNIVAFLTGLSVEELARVCWPTIETPFDECHFLWKNFSQAGYYTSFLEDRIDIGAFEYDKKGFKEPPTDDYVRDLMRSMNRLIGHSGNKDSLICLGPRLAFDVLLDKMKKMAVQLKQPYFQLVWASGGFHAYLDFPRSADESLLETLKWFQEEGYLERSILVFLSDHGQRYGDNRQTEQGAVEAKMPFLYFVLPRWFQEQFPEAVTNMHLNRKRLSSPFDLHETLQDLLHIQELGTERRQRAVHARGISHFSKIPWNRSCDDAGIPATWCPCMEEGAVFQSVSTTLPIVSNGSKLLVDGINSIVSASNLCATVQLKQVLNADVLLSSGIVFNSSSLDAEFVKLTLTIETVPGNGIFQGTLVRNETDWTIFGIISRINAYRNQSDCVKSFLRNYCFCIVQN